MDYEVLWGQRYTSAIIYMGHAVIGAHLVDDSSVIDVKVMIKKSENLSWIFQMLELLYHLLICS